MVRVVPRQGEGNLGVLGRAVCAAVAIGSPVPLDIVFNWLGAQPPKWQVWNWAEGGWGRVDPGSRGARMRTCGETQSSCPTQLSIPTATSTIPL